MALVRSGRMTTGRRAGRRLPARWGFCRRAQPRPAALPLVLLLLALSTLFLLGGDREYFYRPGHHDWNSAQGLAFAENLSFQDNLLVFPYRSQDADGKATYPKPYNRFPPGGFALIKLAILPFGDTDFQAKTYAARMLMLLLFSAAAVLAYHSLVRIAGRRWDALTATLLAFSSYYLLYYADKISNEVTIDLFALMLAFHGMVIFVQEGRFRQLLIKSCVALLLGWHVYAFLLPFIIFGIVSDLLKTRHHVGGRPALTGQLLCCWRTVRGSRYLLLGIVTLLFGIAILAFNFGNEYYALDGAVPLQELPSVSSAFKRLGGNARLNSYTANLLQSGDFFYEQFRRIGQLLLPYALNPYAAGGQFGDPEFIGYPVIALGIVALGIAALGIGLAGLVGVRRRPGAPLLLATLTVAGFCWALPLYSNVIFHDFESVFYIGIPLAVFTLILRCLRRLDRGQLAPILAVAALAVFIISASAMSNVGQSAAELAVEAAEQADYTAIRQLVDDHDAVYIPWRPETTKSGGATWASQYFLAGKTLTYRYDPATVPAARPPGRNYLLLPTRADTTALLTPDNRHLFLYDYARYVAEYNEASLGRRIITARWNVYLRDDRLVYASAECANWNARFFLHFVPQSAAVLPASRQQHGYANHDFGFPGQRAYALAGQCVIERALPDYDLIAIRTGQYTATGRIWAGEYLLPAMPSGPK